MGIHKCINIALVKQCIDDIRKRFIPVMDYFNSSGQEVKAQI